VPGSVVLKPHRLLQLLPGQAGHAACPIVVKEETGIGRGGLGNVTHGVVAKALCYTVAVANLGHQASRVMGVTCRLAPGVGGQSQPAVGIVIIAPAATEGVGLGSDPPGGVIVPAGGVAARVSGRGQGAQGVICVAGDATQGVCNSRQLAGVVVIVRSGMAGGVCYRSQLPEVVIGKFRGAAQGIGNGSIQSPLIVAEAGGVTQRVGDLDRQAAPIILILPAATEGVNLFLQVTGGVETLLAYGPHWIRYSYCPPLF